MDIKISCLLIMFFVSGCSSEQLYATGRNALRAECVQQADSNAQDRCFKEANLSHDAYQSEAKAVNK